MRKQRKQWQVLFSWAPKSLQMVTQFSSVQFSSVIQSCPTLCNPMDCSTPGLPVHHQLLEFTKTHVQWVSDAIQPSHPLLSLLLLPSIFPSIRVFSNESVLRIRWPKYWSFSFSISPSNEYLGLIFFSIYLDRGLTHLKRPWCWERLKEWGEGDDGGGDGWMA